MNERIKEFALQAGGSHYPDVGGETLENFALMIINECIKISVFKGDSTTGKEIKKHFGVDDE